MSNAQFKVPHPLNEPILDYKSGSIEKKNLKAELAAARKSSKEIPMFIGGNHVKSGDLKKIYSPHELTLELGSYHKGNKTHIDLAIQSALDAKPRWEALPWQERAAVFLRAADLLSGPWRATMNAATMMCQSKNVYQSEIDAVVELCDFFRFNAYYATEMYQVQPYSPKNTWNRMEFRPLEGFVFALTPFNFTSIAANLPCAPALMGNTVVWKPAESQIYSACIIMELLEAAGLPPGVINLVYVDGKTAGDTIFKHRDFAGIHFTGSTSVFRQIWQDIALNLPNYRSYPRIVGETGGKDFVLAHPSASADAVAVALVRGAFEYQGQKCSAASRAYVPESLWPAVKARMCADLSTITVGSPENFTHFINAVIDRKAYDKIVSYIESAKKIKGNTLIYGGTYDDQKGYFITPTVIQSDDPKSLTMCEEIFGPVLTIHVYPDAQYEEVMQLVDSTSEYALTGAIFCQDRSIIQHSISVLKHAAGNLYINDKPTGAVVGQQPFGGARGSGTNDKAGSILNLYRWVSALTLKENFVPPTDYRYPFLEEA